jgi:hypothetical protein
MVSLARSADERKIIIPLCSNSGVSDSSVKVTSFGGTSSSDIKAICLRSLKTLEESVCIEFLSTIMDCICEMRCDLFACIAAAKINDPVGSLHLFCNDAIQMYNLAIPRGLT